ncbi:MAG TPA: 2-amino-4-hydroxy-6-hydroxymethyldihydropteridine diphosphokinase [Candidatus Baltobacteraceae bacterium]|nr:2-amino-4-hydroxy-6-hydroxymethyldihydropteridine diphosphokinase [Candidatus Baltobacteraceae bacterium]
MVIFLLPFGKRIAVLWTMRGTMSAVARIGLGANLGDRRAAINAACAGLEHLGIVLARSSVYRSVPWGLREQPEFLNAAVLLETSLEPLDVLAELKRIERKVGRVERVRWGPREIDLDLLTYNDLRVDGPDLILPHPRMNERAFVLAPLAEIDLSFLPAYEALPEADRSGVERLD